MNEIPGVDLSTAPWYVGIAVAIILGVITAAARYLNKRQDVHAKREPTWRELMGEMDAERQKRYAAQAAFHVADNLNRTLRGVFRGYAWRVTAAHPDAAPNDYEKSVMEQEPDYPEFDETVNP